MQHHSLNLQLGEQGTMNGMSDRLKFIEIASAKHPEEKCWWPCLELEGFGQLKQMRLEPGILAEYLQNTKGKKESMYKIAWLLGSQTPSGSRIHIIDRSLSLLDFSTHAILFCRSDPDFLDALDRALDIQSCDSSDKAINDGGNINLNEQCENDGNEGGNTIEMTNSITSPMIEEVAFASNFSPSTEQQKEAYDSTNEVNQMCAEDDAITKSDDVDVTINSCHESSNQAFTSTPNMSEVEFQDFQTKAHVSYDISDILKDEVHNMQVATQPKDQPALMVHGTGINATNSSSHVNDSSQTQGEFAVEEFPNDSIDSKAKECQVLITQDQKCLPSSPRVNKTKQEQVKMITFQDVKGNLMNAGFIFREDLFCRPGMDPDLNPSALPNEDYFTTQLEFRRNLCAYGLDDYPQWTRKTREKIEEWVRWAIAPDFMLSSKNRMDVKEINGIKAFGLLRKIGINHCYGSLATGEYYFCPGAKNGGKSGVDWFENQRALQRHLVTFGFPEACKWDELSQEEMIQLVMYFVDNAKVNTFERRREEKCNNTSASWSQQGSRHSPRILKKGIVNSEAARPTPVTCNSPPGRRSEHNNDSTSRCSSTGESGSSAKISGKGTTRTKAIQSTPLAKSRSRSSPRGRSPQDSVSHCSSQRGARYIARLRQKDVSNSEAHLSTRSGKGRILQPPREVSSSKRFKKSPEVSASVQFLTPQSIIEKESSNDVLAIASAVSLSPPCTESRIRHDFPEFTGTDKERLHACLDALRPSMPGNPTSFDTQGKSSFTLNLQKIQSFLRAFLASDGSAYTTQFENSESPSHDIHSHVNSSAMHVCGVPGIGKTLGVKWCCDCEIAQHNSMFGETVKLLHMNGSSQPTYDSALTTIANCLGLQNNDTLTIEKKLTRASGRKLTLLVIVDEIDLLISENSNGTEAVGKEKIVKLFLSWANDPELRFGLIGISNSLGNRKRERLHQLGSVQQTVQFNAYNTFEINQILKSRVGTTLFTEGALEFIGKKVGSQSGDIRHVFDIAARAAQLKLMETQDEDKSDGCLIDLKVVMKATKSPETDYSALLQRQPIADISVLLVLVALSKANHPTPTGLELKSYVQLCLYDSSRVEEILHGSNFLSAVERLADQGILSTGKSLRSDKSVRDQANARIFLLTPVEDLERALEQVIKGNDFYSRLYFVANEKANSVWSQQ